MTERHRFWVRASRKEVDAVKEKAVRVGKLLEVYLREKIFRRKK